MCQQPAYVLRTHSDQAGSDFASLKLLFRASLDTELLRGRVVSVTERFH